MKPLLLLALPFLACGLIPAAEWPAYSEALNLASQRARERNIEKDKAIYVLGHWQSEEVHISKGKEEKVQVPFCKIYTTSEHKTLETLSAVHMENRYDDKIYQIEIRRAGNDQPVMKITGTLSQIVLSQYPLKAGDLILISVPLRKN